MPANTDVEYHSLYGGEVELVYDPNSNRNRYTVNGKPVKGVTSALGILDKPALRSWAVNQTVSFLKQKIKPGRTYDEVQLQELFKESKSAAYKKTDKAADMGTFIHDWIEQYLMGNKPDIPINSQLKRAVSQFLEFMEQNEIEVIDQERPVYSRTHNFAGRPDMKAMMNGKLTIVDWKTGSGIYPEYFLQGGAYALADEEENGQAIEQIAVINCSVKTTFKSFVSSDVQLAKDTYLKVLDISNSMAKATKEVNQLIVG